MKPEDERQIWNAVYARAFSRQAERGVLYPAASRGAIELADAAVSEAKTNIRRFPKREVGALCDCPSTTFFNGACAKCGGSE
jgi:hypothetical protein